MISPFKYCLTTLRYLEIDIYQSPNDIGINIVTLTITDYGGNDASHDAMVTVEENTLSTLEFDNQTVGIYPNPFNGYITVQLSSFYNNTDFQINIFEFNTETKVVLKQITTELKNMNKTIDRYFNHDTLDP